MGGELFLSGGGNEQKAKEINKIFLKPIKSVLYIPIAWNNEDFDACLKWFKNAMFMHKHIEIEMLVDLNKKINLSKFDAIYIGGGNTFKLLKKIKDSKFDKKLIDYYKKGGNIFGGSAGAIILGYNINIAKLCRDRDVNEVELKDTNGLNLANGFDIQCHYEDNQLKEHQDFIKKTGRDIIAIPEDSALKIENNELKAIGPSSLTIITKNSARKVNHDKILQ